jgi:hypothetical protein
MLVYLTYIPLTLYPRRDSRGISDIPPRHPRFTKIAMRNTVDVTGGKPLAVLLQSISGVSAINLLVALYDIHGGKREVLFFYFVSDTSRDACLSYRCKHYKSFNCFLRYPQKKGRGALIVFLYSKNHTVSHN